LFVAAAAMKIVTLPTALIGLLVVGVLDRRQLFRSLVSSVVIGVLYVVVTMIWVPWEVTWLIDIRPLQPPFSASLHEAPMFFLASAAHWPAMILFPAALILANRTERLVVMAAVFLATASIVFQGQYFQYHAGTLFVITTVAVFRALKSQVTNRTGIGILAIVVAAAALSATSTAWRGSHQATWGAVTIAVAVIGIGWALAVRSQQIPRRHLGLVVAALTTLALLYPAMTPFSAGLVRMSGTGIPEVVRDLGTPTPEEGTAREVRRRIGKNVPVTYLTFGDWAYFLGNPTFCRYPSPLFLQRTRYTTAHLESWSYQENLACIDEPRSQWLIVERGWFHLSKAPPELQARVAAQWDCGAAFKTGELTICPRRV
jgi:hypothetical protein